MEGNSEQSKRNLNSRIDYVSRVVSVKVDLHFSSHARLGLCHFPSITKPSHDRGNPIAGRWEAAQHAEIQPTEAPSR
jgi:hypothetical protein